MDETLQLLEDSLRPFHDNKSIFVDLDIRDAFNIPKLHSARHYVEYIKLYGTLDNFNTEYSERLHIDLAKDAYAATNHKDEFTLMTIWLERKEKILRHCQYVEWRLKGCPRPPRIEWTPPGLELDRTRKLTKHPSLLAVPLDVLVTKYGATHFHTALARFIALSNDPDLTRGQLERKLWGIRMPFTKVAVWHRIKFMRTDPSTLLVSTSDSIHCRPERKDSHGKPIPSRFDTALINDGTGEDIGLDGTSFVLIFWHNIRSFSRKSGYHIGRIRVVFSIPERALPIVYTDSTEVPEHLAYGIHQMVYPSPRQPRTQSPAVQSFTAEG